MNKDNEMIPIGTWIHIDLPEYPRFIGFTYIDPEAGLSAKGGAQDDPDLAEAIHIIVRLPMTGRAWNPLTEEEIRDLGLPKTPEWLKHYGPQPKPGTLWGAWRNHPKLLGRFHPDYPDDLRVVVHDGGPRISSSLPEVIWVRVTGMADEFFRGSLLNQPHHLETVRQGDEIMFIVPEKGKYPLQVREKYLQERGDWIIHPCNKCGLSELFDAPSDLIRKSFPNAPEGMGMSFFTTFCGACGGNQIITRKK